MAASPADLHRIARLNDEAKELLDQALREALTLGHNWVGQEHIRMALARLDLRSSRRQI